MDIIECVHIKLVESDKFNFIIEDEIYDNEDEMYETDIIVESNIELSNIKNWLTNDEADQFLEVKLKNKDKLILLKQSIVYCRIIYKKETSVSINYD